MSPWPTVKLSKLTTKVGSGSTPRGGSEAYKAEGVPLIRSMNVHFDGVRDEGLAFIDEAQARALDGVTVRAGDVLLNITGASIGRVALAPERLDGARVNQHVCIIRTREALDAQFLKLFLNAPAQQDLVMAEESGATRQALTKEKILGFDIPLPPLNEQRRIVAKLEALQARSRRAREALDTVPPLLEKLRQSILAAAFRGDLTKDWRAKNKNVEPASELLERIRAERRKKWEEAELAKLKAKGKPPTDDKWKSKYKEPAPVDTTGLPELPEGWCWARFEDVATIAADLVDPAAHQGMPHVAPDNIVKGTGEVVDVRTVAEDKVISPNHLFRRGQILYSKIRPYLNKCAVAEFNGLCSADMYPIDAAIDAYFLRSFMLSGRFVGEIQERAGNRVVLPKANQKQLRGVCIPVAPALEQRAIAETIRRHEQVLLQSSATLHALAQSLVSLDTALLAKAFGGELVPQDPSDEPAEAMLARLRAEGAEAESPAKGSRAGKGSASRSRREVAS